tara:strand:+ start:479 stop:1081 length:603 start_codon:yes stop_codon:yes gene_type:complete
MKLLFESFRKYVNEQNTEQEDLNTQVALKIARGGLQDVALGMSDDEEDREEYGLRETKEQEKKLKLSTTNIRKVFKKEGGALGMKALEDAIDASKSEIKDVLDTMVDVRTHEHGDYIEDDDKEIDFKKVAETIREEVRMFLEKRKKSKSKKKKSSSKKDACYHKVKSRYKVWPSAYASGALVRCRKVGAKNWGNKSKKKK